MIVDLGFVGEVTSVNARLLQLLVQADSIPVIATIGRDQAGGKLNVNADTAAGAVAATVKAEKLVIVSDTHGIRRDVTDPDSRVSHLDVAQIEQMVKEGTITSGMLPKVEACVTALSCTRFPATRNSPAVSKPSVLAPEKIALPPTLRVGIAASIRSRPSRVVQKSPGVVNEKPFRSSVPPSTVTSDVLESAIIVTLPLSCTTPSIDCAACCISAVDWSAEAARAAISLTASLERSMRMARSSMLVLMLCAAAVTCSTSLSVPSAEVTARLRTSMLAVMSVAYLTTVAGFPAASMIGL